MEYRYRAQGEAFEADATYMQVEYGLRPFDSDVKVHYEIEEARQLLGIREDDPWGENPDEWCDLITTRRGHLLAIAADGELGHPGTNYRVREIEEEVPEPVVNDTPRMFRRDGSEMDPWESE